MEMWILSQNKKVLGQFTNLWVKENRSGDFIVLGCNGPIIDYDNVASSFQLGNYMSKQRALEIYNEIKEHINNNYADVYEMPEE